MVTDRPGKVSGLNRDPFNRAELPASSAKGTRNMNARGTAFPIPRPVIGGYFYDDGLDYDISADPGEGGWEYDENGFVSLVGAEDLNTLMAKTTKMPNRQLLQTLSKTAVSHALAKQVPAPVARAVARLTTMARAVQDQLGRIDAYEQRRPNSLCCVYGAALAPGATVAFDVVPSGGQSWYRLLAFLTGDDQAQVFGFTSLRVGGMDQIFSTQTLPTPAPVANASAWYGFVARGDNQVFNLAPWTGFTFSNDVHVTGTIVNMTIAATGDAITLGPRFLIPVQTDPCGQFTGLYREAGRQLTARLDASRAMYGAPSNSILR